MWNYNHSDELYHYGIKGMKWGVHRATKRDPSVKAARRQVREDLNETKKALGKRLLTVNNLSKSRRLQTKEEFQNAREKLKKSFNKWDSLSNKTAKEIDKARKSPLSDDAIEASKIERKNVKQMSNAEIRKANERAQLEQTYANLHPGMYQKAKSAVKEALSTVKLAEDVTNTATSIITKHGKAAADSAIDILSEGYIKA